MQLEPVSRGASALSKKLINRTLTRCAAGACDLGMLLQGVPRISWLTVKRHGTNAVPPPLSKLLVNS
jgi:hypothetical protein